MNETNMVGAMLNENEVVHAMCRHLEEAGYQIIQRCSTKDKGIDIIAKHPSQAGRLRIEAKGGTSARQGSLRFGKGFKRSQVFDRVAKCFYTAAEYAAEGKDGDTVAMAFPDTAYFREYLGRIKPVTDKLGLSVFLVRDDHSVESF